MSPLPMAIEITYVVKNNRKKIILTVVDALAKSFIERTIAANTLNPHLRLGVTITQRIFTSVNYTFTIENHFYVFGGI